MKQPLLIAAGLVLVSGAAMEPRAAEGQSENLSNKPPAAVNLNTPRDFPKISSRKEWEERAKNVREQILVSCGLWPMPDKTALNPKIFGKTEHDGYTIEKVYLETYPGFYLAGNLYRPSGGAKGPFPAILNPHGHWGNGRMADTPEGSIAARCISFARQGMIAFSYDMTGYNDTHFSDTPTNKPFYEVHRMFATNHADLLWNISLMGLQTWNSVRALDFLESLPDADKKRLACTGESGGGTQTFMLGAIDDRLAAQAPVVMVSHTMQGGCLCENAPGLRVQYSNMEISAAAAPRPQILVAATGDWTKDTLTTEGPAIAGIYQLFGGQDRFHYVRFDFGHNYNKTSREAVYQWFGRWLLKRPSPAALQEASYQKEPDAELRVFPDGRLPLGALTQADFAESLKEMHRRQWQKLAPKSKSSLKKYQEIMRPAWQHTLQLDGARSTTEIRANDLTLAGELTTATLSIRRPDEGAELSATYWAPPGILDNTSRRVAVLARENGKGTQGTNATSPSALASALLGHGVAVLEVNHYSSEETADQFADFYSTYNRTKLQQRVRDLITLCTAAKSVDPRKSVSFQVIIVGTGQAGPWALLAAPMADGAVADACSLNPADETALLSNNWFCPGLLSLGGFEGAAILAAARPMLIHNAGSAFTGEHLSAAFKAGGAKSKFQVAAESLSEAEIGNWMAQVE